MKHREGCRDYDLCDCEWLDRLDTLRNEGGFHWRHDIFFKRMEEGFVRIRQLSNLNYAKDLLISPSEWASIVAAVTARGETTETYYAALEFHNKL